MVPFIVLLLTLGFFFYLKYSNSGKSINKDDIDPFEHTETGKITQSIDNTFVKNVPIVDISTKNKSIKISNDKINSEQETIFINGNWTHTEAKITCESMGKKLCTNNQICKPGGTIFKDKKGIFNKMVRTWLGDKNRCDDNRHPWKYIGSLSANQCYDGIQFNRCGNKNLKLEAFACCD